MAIVLFCIRKKRKKIFSFCVWKEKSELQWPWWNQLPRILTTYMSVSHSILSCMWFKLNRPQPFMCLIRLNLQWKQIMPFFFFHYETLQHFSILSFISDDAHMAVTSNSLQMVCWWRFLTALWKHEIPTNWWAVPITIRVMGLYMLCCLWNFSSIWVT